LPPPQAELKTDSEPEHGSASRPHLRQLALQSAAAFAVLSLAWPYFGIQNLVFPWPWIAVAIAGVALLFSILTRNPWWWSFIHAIFAPMAWWISTRGIAPGWFLLAFFSLLLVYRGALGGQIPLYFSNQATTGALAELISKLPGVRFVDLGAGIGSVVCPLARTRQDAIFVGLENAPATWLIAWARALGIRNCDVRMADFWRENLAQYKVVYAFLSPSPMPDLWAKIQREMLPGSLFISNSFAVPDVSPTRIVEVNDRRGTKLYCYQR